MAGQIRDLPHALKYSDEVAQRLAERRPAVFLDYDGTLTPIVDRPEDATISESMRDAIRALAGRCPVVIVSALAIPASLIATFTLPSASAMTRSVFGVLVV